MLNLATIAPTHSQWTAALRRLYWRGTSDQGEAQSVIEQLTKMDIIFKFFWEGDFLRQLHVPFVFFHDMMLCHWLRTKMSMVFDNFVLAHWVPERASAKSVCNRQNRTCRCILLWKSIYRKWCTLCMLAQRDAWRNSAPRLPYGHIFVEI